MGLYVEFKSYVGQRDALVTFENGILRVNGKINSRTEVNGIRRHDIRVRENIPVFAHGSLEMGFDLGMLAHSHSEPRIDSIANVSPIFAVNSCVAGGVAGLG